MSGILRLSNTATGQSTLDTNATTDVTYSLPDTGSDSAAIILTDDAHEVTSINWDGIAVNIENGDINLDDGTLFIDHINDRVGIGTTSPAYKLDVTGGGIGINTTGGDTVIELNVDGSGEFTGDVQMASQNGGPLAGFRNQIINGDFRVWQRGTSVDVADDTTAFTADRLASQGSGSLNVRRVDNPFASAPFAYAAQYSTTNPSGCRVRLSVELPDTGKAGPFLIGSTWTLSWYCNDASFSFANIYFADYSYGTNTVNSGNFSAVTSLGGNRYSQTVTIDAAPNASNSCAWFNTVIPIDGFQITGVQLEPGPVVTPFEHRPYGTELALCQRYYYRTTLNNRISIIRSSGGNSQSAPMFYNTRMRQAPIASVIAAPPAILRTSDDLVSTQITCNVTGCFGSLDSWQVSPDKELAGATQLLAFDTVVDFSAEL